MFPSTNNGNEQENYNRPFFNDIITPNYNSKQEENNLLSFFHFPSPLIPYELELNDYHDVLLQQNHDLLLHLQPLSGITWEESNRADINELSKVCNKKSQNSTTGQIPRKRTSKRDRHSKIHTAQGPRDRRMRLSLKVAREFFDLQDKLGFDKPSKTVEWLLVQSKAEIKKICNGFTHHINYSKSTTASSTSECEVVSGIIDEPAPTKGSICKGKSALKKEKRIRPLRRTAYDPLARESREKARERARERTKEKMLQSRKLEESKPCEEAINKELGQFGCWSPFETGEESGNLEVLADNEARTSRRQGTTESMIDETLVIMSKWSPSSSFNHLHNPGILHELQYQFADFQSSTKSWEAYNMQSLC